MRFWDSSALVPLLAKEPAHARAAALYREDAEVIVWWGTSVECASAIARREREGAFTPAAAAECFRRLDAFAASWIGVEPSSEIREIARRLLRVHPLRASDALQLAAAIVAAERRPPTLGFVTQDHRLHEAAVKEGFLATAV